MTLFTKKSFINITVMINLAEVAAIKNIIIMN